METGSNATTTSHDPGTQDPTTPSENAGQVELNTTGRLFSGFYLPHPVYQEQWGREGLKGEGLVSTIRDEPTDLKWIYVYRDKSEVKYGSRAESAGHLLGPWDCTERERPVTFEGWEGFLAVEEAPETHPGVWALYFDRSNDGLGGRPGRSVAMLLYRREPPRTRQLRDEEAGRATRSHGHEYLRIFIKGREEESSSGDHDMQAMT
ncbi:hypothetical protein DHEL01_v210383 [Diaporthe helianthi]|uniref:Uncharacterized protein n=1 Tax=Diaporthe helianthi TaxID=158607 RepID=A0A2P5HLU8_DIAHE|nr:hypothetical protein DHEL01_v210383 [Diaporthe helianthi]